MVEMKLMGIEKEYIIPSGEYIMGRKFEESGAHIQIQEYDMEGVSRYHCDIKNTDGILQIKDAGSKNGTYINNEKIKPHKFHKLSNLDNLTLGNCTLEVKIKNQLFRQNGRTKI